LTAFTFNCISSSQCTAYHKHVLNPMIMSAESVAERLSSTSSDEEKSWRLEI